MSTSLGTSLVLSDIVSCQLATKIALILFLGIPLVSNAVMACVAHHPFFEYVITNLAYHTGWSAWNDILHSTGPYMLTQVYK